MISWKDLLVEPESLRELSGSHRMLHIQNKKLIYNSRRPLPPKLKNKNINRSWKILCHRCEQIDRYKVYYITCNNINSEQLKSEVV